MARSRPVRRRLIMLLVPIGVETSAQEQPRQRTPVVWIWSALVLGLFASERLVRVDHDLGLAWFPPDLFIGVTFTVASWSLYADPVLFDLWQLWSHVLVHPTWWLLAVEIVLMVVVGRALERTLGTALFLAVLGCLAPLGGVLLVLAGPEPVFAGGLPLMAGLIGVALGRLPTAPVRWGLVWWAVVAVGHLPLFRTPLQTLLVLVLALALVATPPVAALPSLLATAAVAGTGFGLGLLIRRRAAPGA